MAQIVEFVQDGVFLEGLPDEIARDVTALVMLMTGRVVDAALALTLFEESSAAMWARLERERDAPRDSWEQDRQAEQAREHELQARNPPPEATGWADPAYREWENAIREQARRDVVRAKWAAQLPDGYQQRLPMLHARSQTR